LPLCWPSGAPQPQGLGSAANLLVSTEYVFEDAIDRRSGAGSVCKRIGLKNIPLLYQPLTAKLHRDRQQHVKLWIEQGRTNAHRIAGSGVGPNKAGKLAPKILSEIFVQGGLQSAANWRGRQREAKNTPPSRRCFVARCRECGILQPCPHHRNRPKRRINRNPCREPIRDSRN
jgi:hypothetical protein